jgi:hypothetical protein
MHIIEEQEFCDKAYSAFTRVFNLKIDKSYCFSEFISSRIIVHDTSSDCIDDAVPMRTIITAGRTVGDKGCYFHLPYPNLREPDYYYSPFDELEEAYYFNYDDYPDKKARKQIAKKISDWAYRYPIFGGTTSTMIYSESSQWGIRTDLCSSWGILGGTNNFISKIKQELPAIEQQVFTFLFEFYVACRSNNTNFCTQIEGEIKSDLVHVYGLNRANKIINMTPKKLLERSGKNLSDFVHPDFISEYAILE